VSIAAVELSPPDSASPAASSVHPLATITASPHARVFTRLP
jgi:hypothetical protein